MSKHNKKAIQVDRRNPIQIVQDSYKLYREAFLLLAPPIANLNAAVLTVAELAFSTNGPETRDRMSSQTSDILKYGADMIMACNQLEGNPIVPINRETIANHVSACNKLAGQAADFLKTGKDESQATLRNYIRQNKPEMLTLPDALDRKSRGSPGKQGDWLTTEVQRLQSLGMSINEAIQDIRPRLEAEEAVSTWNQADLKNAPWWYKPLKDIRDSADPSGMLKKRVKPRLLLGKQ